LSTAWIQTYTGRKFFPLEPVAADIDPLDVAHALSNQCRFSGHTSRFYSVGEHSVHVANLLRDRGEPIDTVRWGLLHDATEAYLIDMPRPLKQDAEFGAMYRQAEAVLHMCVAARFGLPAEIPDAVHQADNDLLLTEKRDLLGPSPDLWYVGPGEAVDDLDLREQCLPGKAETLFLRLFHELSGEVIQ